MPYAGGLDAALPAASAFGDSIVIEELLDGEELSLFAVCDGARAVPLPAVQDFKRLARATRARTPAGWAAFSPVPADVEGLVASIQQPVLDELAARGTPFVGVLFAAA